MKKLLSTILFALLCCYAMAYDFSAVCSTGQTLYYNITSNVEPYTVEVTSETGRGYNTPPTGELEIPESVEYNSITYSITSIGEYAFECCYSLTSVIIPNSVTSIGFRAFWHCEDLTEITIPESVTYISYPFPYCTELSSIVVASGNTMYDSRDNCNAIIETESNTLIFGCKNTTIPNTVTSIGYAPFRGSKLTSITIPESVTNIGDIGQDQVFSECSELSSIVVASGNTIYDSRDNCNAIIETATNKLIASCKSTVIPNSVISIGDNAFSSCLGLTEIQIPESVITIGVGAFQSCTELSLVTIGNSVESIGDDAFAGCSNLTSITIPNSVMNIGSHAFYYCAELSSIVVSSANTIYDSRNNCNAIIETETNTLIVGCNNTIIPNDVIMIGESAFASLLFMTSVTIPNSVKNIGAEAFALCSELTTVILGNAVDTIAIGAFEGDVNISEINILANTPPILGEEVFSSEIHNTANIWTPCQTEDLYRNADGWNQFTNIQNDTSSNFIVTVQSQNETMGSVTGGGNFSCEEEATLIATAENGYLFVQWNDGNTDNPRTITVTSDSTFVANYRSAETVYWACDFEGDEIWTFGNDQQTGNVQWQIVTPDTYPSALISGDNAYLKPFVFQGDTLNDTPEHWAMADLISQSTDLGGPGQVAESSWIEFNNINLIEAEQPQITFRQIFRQLNGVETSIRVSIDGGQTWTDHIVNEEVEGNTYGEYEIRTGIFEAAGEENVTIRFLFNSDAHTTQMGYGWEIDDIAIKETPANDLSIQDARISMFGYIDYRDENALLESNETRETAYQKYDPYAQSPRKQWETENGFAAFNVEVANIGYETITPMARITITNPNGEEIYNKVVSGNRSLSFAEIDTLDFADENLFRFENDVLTGRYNVNFYVFAEGMEVVDSTNQYFDITEKTFSTSYNEPTAYRILDHTNPYEEWYGVRFTYYYDDFIQNIENGNIAIEVFIDEHTSVGSTIYARLYEYDNTYVESFDGNYDDYQEAVNFDAIEIDEHMIGTWINFDVDEHHISNLIYNNINREVPYSFIIAIHPEENETLAIGTSDVLTSMGNNSVKMTENGWHPSNYQLAIRVREISYTIEAMSNNDEYGSVTGGGTYEEGATVTFTAIPNQGYRFVSWNDDNTENPRTITVTSDSTFVANFVQEFADTIILTDYNGNTYDINALLDDGKYVVFDFFFTTDRYSQEEVPDVATLYTQMGCNSGDVILMALEVTTHDAVHDIEWYMTEFGAIYPIVPLESNPTNETLFYNWGFDGTPTYICISPDRSMRELNRPLNYEELVALGAHERDCQAQQYTITVLSSNDAYGSVSGGGTYNDGDIATIMAMPNGGYLFDSWEDDNAENPRTITVTSDSTFVADFVKCEITQTIDTVVPNFVTVGDHTFYSTGNYSFSVLSENDCDTIFDIRLRVLAEPVYDIGPNPTKSLLNINSDGFISAVEFYSVTGQLVMRKEVNGNFAECDVESLVSGVYIVRIFGEESSLPSVYRIVKE